MNIPQLDVQPDGHVNWGPEATPLGGVSGLDERETYRRFLTLCDYLGVTGTIIDNFEDGSATSFDTSRTMRAGILVAWPPLPREPVMTELAPGPADPVSAYSPDRRLRFHERADFTGQHVGNIPVVIGVAYNAVPPSIDVRITQQEPLEGDVADGIYGIVRYGQPPNVPAGSISLESS